MRAPNPGQDDCVLGTGPDWSNRGNTRTGLRSSQWLVVSEFPPGKTGNPEHFPSRNRIIASVSLGTLVIEAGLKSFADHGAAAAEQGREVLHYPVSIHNPMARGCTKLIRYGAKLVETDEEVRRICAVKERARRRD